MRSFDLLLVPSGKTELCMCTKGTSHNGGEPPNDDGVCEYRCSRPIDGIRYCGEGTEYEKGDSIDCQPAQGNPTWMFYIL